MGVGELTNESNTTDRNLYNFKESQVQSSNYPYFFNNYYKPIVQRKIDKMEAMQHETGHSESYFYPNQNSSRTLNNFENDFDSTLNNWFCTKFLNKIDEQNNKITEEIYSSNIVNPNDYCDNNYYSHLNSLNYKKNSLIDKKCKRQTLENQNSKKDILNLDSNKINNLISATLDLTTTTTKPLTSTTMEYKSDLLMQTGTKYENDQKYYNPDYQNLYVKQENEFHASPTQLVQQEFQNFQQNFYNPFVIPSINQFNDYNQHQTDQLSYIQPISPQEQIAFTEEISPKNSPTQDTIYGETIKTVSPNHQQIQEIYSQHQISTTNNMQSTKQNSPTLSQTSKSSKSEQLQSFASLKNKIEQRHKQININECKICDKIFTTSAQLKRHLSSSAHKYQISANNIITNTNVKQEIIDIKSKEKIKRNSTELISDESLNESNEGEQVKSNTQQYKDIYTSSEQAIVSSTSNEPLNPIKNESQHIENNNLQNLYPVQYYHKNANNWSYPSYSAQNPSLSTTLPIPNNNQFTFNINYQSYYQDPIHNGIYNNFNSNTPHNYSPQNYSDNSISPPGNNNFVPITNNPIYLNKTKNSPPNTDGRLSVISNELIVPSFINNFSSSNTQGNVFINCASSTSKSTNPIQAPVHAPVPVICYKTSDLVNSEKTNSTQISPVTSILSDTTIISQPTNDINVKVINKKVIKKKLAKKQKLNHANEQAAKVKCLECNREFAKICYLTQHNKSFHSGDNPYRCFKCGKRFQTEELLNIHVEKHRTIDKPFKCDLCIKQFHHKTDLRRHRESHTGYSAHVCELCHKGFSRRDHLRQHFETHFGIKVRGIKSRKKVNPETIASYDETINIVSMQ